jgi:hypothetical protein
VTCCQRSDASFGNGSKTARPIATTSAVTVQITMKSRSVIPKMGVSRQLPASALGETVLMFVGMSFPGVPGNFLCISDTFKSLVALNPATAGAGPSSRADKRG